MTQEKKIRLGIVGAGVFGGYHTGKVAAHRDAELVGIYDSDQTRCKASASQFGCKPFTRLSNLIAQVDGLIIACSASFHADAALSAIKSGKHVLIEKPIATNAKDGRAIVEAAKTHNVILQIGHQERFVMQAIGIEKATEKPVFIKAKRMGPFSPRGTDVSVTLDLMTHDLDMVFWIMGGPAQRIDGQSIAVRSQTPDAAQASLYFDGGAKAELEASRVEDGRDRMMEIHYPTGVLKIDFVNKTFEDTTGYGFNAGFGDDPRAADSLGAGTDAFITAIKTNSAPPVTGEDGLLAMMAALEIDGEVS
ncbi:Gfo/Idh/MocA family protein [Robiginitomaculum antarcticum]|uniref:Gfo/Idh/MocA family protein n=1 Tax=Robiginitomaculum antarcticum TaxID=437507 RepID=UPI00036A0C4D|nr:Gfo/Idh/MocA family oxidoreductase [Robiginitomaculum antarcticum]